MTERRQWTEEEDQQIKRLQSANCLRTKKGQKLKWDEIAEHLRKNIKNSHRSGKQCRQRWHNQLDPNVIQDKQWMEEQIQILLDKQKIYGNRWAEVAKWLKGRTDNNVKNFFYSTLRRGVRRINAYISSIRKKSHPIKQINQSVLSKILTVADERHTEEKVKIKKQNEIIIELAKNIRDLLINISLQQKQQNDKIINNQQKKERVIHDIVEFNKNCKRKKSKKKSEEQQISQEQDQIHVNIQQKPKITTQRPFSLFKTFCQPNQKDATKGCLKNSQSINEEIRQTRSRKTKKITKIDKLVQSKKQQILENNLSNIDLHNKMTSNYEIKANQKNVGQSISFQKIIVKSNQNSGTQHFWQNMELIKKRKTQQQGQKDIFGVYQQPFNGILLKSMQFKDIKKDIRDFSVDFMKMSGLDAPPLINLKSSFSFNNNQGRASESFNGSNNDLKKRNNQKCQ